MKRIATGLSVVVMVLLLATPVLAGGWATVTVDDVPLTVRVDEAIQLGFVVRQHGSHPITLTNPSPLLIARHLQSGETVQFEAVPDAETGHYSVEVTFPAAGEWAWQIHPAPFPAVDMAPILVESEVATRTPQTDWRWVGPALGLLLSGVSLALWRSAEHPRVALAVGGLSAVMALSPLWQTAPATTSPHVEPVHDAVATGRALFLAKGCVTCHLHADVTTNFTVEMGPELTHYVADSTYIENWLRAPEAIKPNTQMPNLELDEAEIGALTAFLLAAETP
jgi:hypothetical protein